MTLKFSEVAGIDKFLPREGLGKLSLTTQVSRLECGLSFGGG